MIEIIATNVKDCLTINKASNINRIELCQSLTVGGLTPEYEVIKRCTEVSSVPVRVIIRHHYQDFYCPENEYALMKKDIAFVKTTKAEGIVIGILTRQNEIDLPRMKEIIKLAKPLKITFHRAFDQLENKISAIKILAQLNISTVLTQGGMEPVMNNLQTLDSLRKHGVEIQAGSGINLSNFAEVAQFCDAIHLGSSVRKNNDWEEEIELIKLKKLVLR